MVEEQRAWSSRRVSVAEAVIVAVIAAAVAATQQIREAAEQLAAEQAQWAATSERLEKLVDEIENALREDSGELIHGHLHTGRRGAAPRRRAGNVLKATWG